MSQPEPSGDSFTMDHALVFTFEELRPLLLAVQLEGSRGDAAREKLRHTLAWATRVRTSAATLELVLAGKVRLRVRADGTIQVAASAADRALAARFNALSDDTPGADAPGEEAFLAPGTDAPGEDEFLRRLSGDV